MKLLCIGDTHFKDNLSYADYISDGRKGEKKEILDFIIKSAEDCDHIVLMGDNFNSKNNSSETNREFVEFIERFENKQIYIMSGNHEKKGDGSTAIDFLGEVKKSNWHIFTNYTSIDIEGNKIDFLPYMLNSELDVTTSEEGRSEVMKQLDGGHILFAHHSISGSSINGMDVSMFKEIVLPNEELEKRYKLVVAGHIHEPQEYNNILITGSLFTDCVGETEKFIWKIQAVTHNNVKKNHSYVIAEPGKWMFEIEKLKVPARPLFKLINPTPAELENYPKKSIVKIVLTNKEIQIEEIKEIASKFDAHLIIEDYPNERKRMQIEEGAFDFSIEALLKLYSEAKGIDLKKLLKGLSLIRN